MKMHSKQGSLNTAFVKLFWMMDPIGMDILTRSRNQKEDTLRRTQAIRFTTSEIDQIIIMVSFFGSLQGSPN